MYRFLDRLTPDDIAAITAQAYVEMLESGYTRVGEFHYLHNDIDGGAYADPAETAAAIVAAAETAGIGLTLLPVFYAHADFGGAPPESGATPLHLRRRRLRPAGRGAAAPSCLPTRAWASRRIRCAR